MNIAALSLLALACRLSHAGWPWNWKKGDDSPKYMKLGDDEDRGAVGGQDSHGTTVSVPIDMHALDLAAPSDRQVVSREDFYDGFKWLIYVPKTNVKLKRIMDGGMIITEIEGELRYIKVSIDDKQKLMFVHSKVTRGWKVLCFEKINNQWYDVGGGEVYKGRSKSKGTKKDDKSCNCRFW